ncbi:hypothetical protein FRB90_005429 [Tulasnella sp. 427]|nr:hypothetical protein FRB90_005429 [Tulasnella sp. 427]
MDPNLIAAMTPQARRALLAYIAALGSEEGPSNNLSDTQTTADPPAQPDPIPTQPAPATRSEPATSSGGGLVPGNLPAGPESPSATPLPEPDLYSLLDLPPLPPPTPQTSALYPQHQAGTGSFGSPLPVNPALGYNPTAAQVLAASNPTVAQVLAATRAQPGSATTAFIG